MRIIIVGATGFIGRSFVSSCIGKGYQIVALVRDRNRARNLLGNNVEIVDINDSDEILKEIFENSDALVNLSGKQLAGVRWTSAKKREFESSRIGVANRLSEIVLDCKNPPKVIVSSSAVGVYGNRSSEKLFEHSQLGSDYLSQMCVDWEAAAASSQRKETRVCLLRFGVVIGREGGILKQIMPGFNFGIGSYIGNGRQIVPWVHISDVVNVIHKCISDSEMFGSVNVTSPNPVTSKDFALKLANITNAKFVLPVPSVFLKIVFGEGEKVLTNSQNAFPEKLIQQSFEFQFPDLESSLAEEVKVDDVTISKITSLEQKHDFIRLDNPTKHSPQYELKTKTVINASVSDVFDFFADPSNLSLTTPTWMNFKMISYPEKVELDSKMTYMISIGFVRLKWETVILTWDNPNSFVDWQRKGPYRLWIHCHEILEQNTSTSLMIDKVYYSMPFGLLGKVVHELFVKHLLKRIFSYRLKIIRLMYK